MTICRRDGGAGKGIIDVVGLEGCELLRAAGLAIRFLMAGSINGIVNLVGKQAAGFGGR